MSTFAVDGLASGLDTTSLINQLMELERQPQVRLQNQLSTQGTVIASYQSVSTRLKSVESAAQTLQDSATWGARGTSVTGTAVTATASSGAPVGRLDVNVSSLATAATWTTDSSYGLDDVVFNVGEPPLTVRRADGTSVSLYPPSGTMRDVMATINDALGLGVRAVAIKVGADQYRLQIIASDTGTDAAPQAIENLGVPATATAATDAAYTINGIAATSGSNRVTDAVSGVTLTLTEVGSATVDVTDDAEAVADAVQSLVDAVNGALEEVATQTLRDAATTRGPLASDSAVRSLTGGLLQAVSDTVGSTSAATVGLETTREGALTFDRDAFLTAYADDAEAVQAIFTPDADDGVVSRLLSVVDRATSTTTGTITLAIQGRESTQRDLENQIANWDLRLSQRRLTLERQFTQLEVSLSRLQAQQNWLAGQIEQFNANAQA